MEPEFVAMNMLIHDWQHILSQWISESIYLYPSTDEIPLTAFCDPHLILDSSLDIPLVTYAVETDNYVEEHFCAVKTTTFGAILAEKQQDQE